MDEMKYLVNKTAEIGAALVSLFVGVGAVAVSSCCVLPLALSFAGVGSAWFGGLTGLIGYRTHFLGAAILALTAASAFAFWRWRAQCTSGGACTRSAGNRLTYGILGISTLLVSVAAAWSWIEPVIILILLKLSEVPA